MQLHGLKTCDTCRKALRELRAAGREVAFVDLRATPPTRKFIDALLAAHGEAAMNRRSKTWAGLPEAERDAPVADLLLRHPALIKRPVIVTDDGIYLGWTDGVRAALIS